MAEKSKYKRVILKLSGEALAGDKGFGIDPETVESIASQIKDVTECGLEVAIVNGGGNIWRGLSGCSVMIQGFTTLTRTALRKTSG